MNHRLLTITLLGFFSGLPLTLLTSTLQAWFAQSGLSVMAVGMLSLVGLPYTYRFLWAPFVDRYRISSLGRRRSWLIICQVLLVLGYCWIGLGEPKQSPQILVFLAFFLAIVSATQDTIIDAHRTEYLQVKEYGLGASFAVAAYRMALLVGGGLALVIADYWGWRFTYQIMAVLTATSILLPLVTKEPQQHLAFQDNNIGKVFAAPLLDLFQKPMIGTLLWFIFLFKLGEAFTTTTSGIVMPFFIQGLGFSLATIGYINKVLGVTAILLGGLVGGILLTRLSLYKALLYFGLAQALSNCLFVVLTMTDKNVIWLGIAVGCDNFVAGMGSTALVVLLMRTISPRFTATQFAMLVSIASLPRVLSGPLAATLQLWFGWADLYKLACLLALCFIPFLIRLENFTWDDACPKILS